MAYEHRPDTRLVALLLTVMVMVPAMIAAELTIPGIQPKFGVSGAPGGGGPVGKGGGGPTGPSFRVLMPNGISLDKSLNFQPKSLTLVVGKNNTLVWVNQDTTDHTVTFTAVPSGVTAASISISDIAPGDSSGPLSLTVPGIYSYHCQFHPGWMKGTLTVKGS